MFLNHLLWIFIISAATRVACGYENENNVQEKIIMDVDAGADDALAMHIVIKNEMMFNGPPVVAITCVAGNTILTNVKHNVLRTLQQLNRTDIPVFIGASEPFFYDVDVSDSFYGNDGFGDFAYDPSTLPKVRNEHAVTTLVRMVSKNPGQITLIALGPLTNVALAMKLDPKFIQKLNRLVILGGGITGVGNISPGIEFNFMKDPEAVHIVLQESHYKKVTLFPWDTVVSADIKKDWRTNVLGKIKNKDIQFINKAEAKSFSKSPFWHNGDSLAAAAGVWSIVKSIQPLRVKVVTCGQARGGLLVDHYRAFVNISSSNLNVVRDVDVEKFKSKLLSIYPVQNDI